jgi:hypothetical protein
MAKRTSRFGSNVTADIERRKSAGSSYGYLKLPPGVNIYKESAGKLKVDIIPYIVTDPNHMDGNPEFPDAANPGNPWYKKPILVHRSVGAENQSVVCPKTVGKKCPICEQRAKQQSQGLEKGELVDKPQLRNLYVVIPIEHKEYEEKFHIWDISNGNFQKKLDEELSENPKAGSFPDPAEGKTLAVRFSEETFNKNKYFEASRIDFEDRDGYEDKIMEQAPNLDEMISIPTYKELEKMFLELGDEDDADDAEQAPVARKKKVVEEKEAEEEQPFRKKKVVKEPEPEEETEEEEEPEPVSKKKKVVEEEVTSFKRKKVVEPEPEEEDEEEEEPAPAPVRKKKVVEEEVVVKKKTTTPAPAATNGSCPSKHVYGKDWDGYDDCDDCPVFKACGVAHEKK